MNRLNALPQLSVAFVQATRRDNPAASTRAELRRQQRYLFAFNGQRFASLGVDEVQEFI